MANVDDLSHREGKHERRDSEQVARGGLDGGPGEFGQVGENSRRNRHDGARCSRGGPWLPGKATQRRLPMRQRARVRLH